MYDFPMQYVGAISSIEGSFPTSTDQEAGGSPKRPGEESKGLGG